MSTATTRKTRTRNTKAAEGNAEREGDGNAPGAALASVTPMITVQAETRLVEIGRIEDPPGNPDRMPKPDDEQRTLELACSIKQLNLMQAIGVEQLVDGRMVRLWGRRRVEACRLLGLKEIEARVYPPLQHDVRRILVAAENIQHDGLSPAEETLAVADMLEYAAIPAARQYGQPLCELCDDQAGVSFRDYRDAGSILPEVLRDITPKLLRDPRVRSIAADMVAAMLAKPATWVRDRMYILRLTPMVRGLIHAGKLPLAHAREIAKLADPKRRDELAEDYAAGGDMSISVVEAGKLEELQEDVRRHVFALCEAPWKLDREFAGKPACAGCPNNSASSPGLFEHGGVVSADMKGGRGTYHTLSAAKAESGGVCTLPSCYEAKLRSAKAAISATAKKIVEQPKPKKGEPAAKPVSVPEYIDPKALDKKVRDRRASSGGGRSSTPKVDPKAKARDAAAARKRAAVAKLDDALQARAQRAHKAIDAALAKIPGAALLLDLLLGTKAFEGMSNSYNRKKALRVASSPAVASAVKKLKNPTLQHFLAIEKEQRGRLNSIQPWGDRDNGFVDVLAKVLGVEVEPTPTLDQFIADAKAEEMEYAGDDADDEGDDE